MIQKPNLLKVSDYKINDKISVHVPTVDEIFDFGDMKYYSIIQTLIATPFDLMVELDDIGIDYETITNFQLFMLMMESIIANEDDTSILFGGLNLKNFQEAVNCKNNEKVLWDKENDIVIDQMIALEICNTIRKIHFWEAPVGQAGNAEAKRYLIERNRRKKQRLAKKPYKSFLENIMIALEMCNAIRKIHFWEAPLGRAGNNEAKRYLIERKRLKTKTCKKTIQVISGGYYCFFSKY